MGLRPTSTSSSSDAAQPAAAEFRPYRRFVSRVILTFSTVGSVWLLLSIAVTIYRRRNAVPSGAPIGLVATAADLETCHEELRDVTQGLASHLENFQLIAHYDADEAQRWAEDRAFWLGQWKAADERCHFAAARTGKLEKDWEQLAVIHAELHETEASYNKELLRFGKDQAPRLARIRERLDRVGQKLASGGAADPVDSPPLNDSTNASPTDSKDAGDRTP